MSEKTREICTVVSQESIGAGIYSMWIQTDRIAADALLTRSEEHTSELQSH